MVEEQLSKMQAPQQDNHSAYKPSGLRPLKPRAPDQEFNRKDVLLYEGKEKQQESGSFNSAGLLA